jgi:hypothetical protein
VHSTALSRTAGISPRFGRCTGKEKVVWKRVTDRYDLKNVGVFTRDIIEEWHNLSEYSEWHELYDGS